MSKMVDEKGVGKRELEGGEEGLNGDGSSMPCKKHYRQRAHCNPLSNNDGFEYPVRPEEMDWTTYYPNIPNAHVDFVDIGCGFGGLTVALAQLFPDKLTLGMEIRSKVTHHIRIHIVHAYSCSHAASLTLDPPPSCTRCASL